MSVPPRLPMPQLNGTKCGLMVARRVTEAGAEALGVYVASTAMVPEGGMKIPITHPLGGHTKTPPAPPSSRNRSKRLPGLPVTTIGTAAAWPACKVTTPSGSSTGVPMQGGTMGVVVVGLLVANVFVAYPPELPRPHVPGAPFGATTAVSCTDAGGVTCAW